MWQDEVFPLWTDTSESTLDSLVTDRQTEIYIRIWTVLHESGWQLRRKLGSGAHGAVYAIKHALHGKRAVKIQMKEDARYEIEVDILASLSRKEITVEVYYEPFGPCQYGYLMDEMPCTLASIKYGKTSMSKTDILDIMTALVSCVRRMHERRVVHFDIKPQNVALDPVRKILRLIDFGLANVQKDDGSWEYEPAWTTPMSPAYPYHTMNTNNGGVRGVHDDYHGVIVIFAELFISPDAFEDVFNPNRHGYCNRTTQTPDAKKPKLNDTKWTSGALVERKDDTALIWDAVDDEKTNCEEGVLKLIAQLRSNPATPPP